MSQTFVSSKLKRNQQLLYSTVDKIHPAALISELLRELNTVEFKLYGGISKQEALYLLLYFMQTNKSYKELDLQFGYAKSNMKQAFGAIRTALEPWFNRQFSAGTFEAREQAAMQCIDLDDLPILWAHHDTEYVPTLKMDGVQVRVRKHSAMRDANCNSFKYHQKTAISMQVAVDFNDLVVFISTWFGGGKQDITQARKIASELKIEANLKDEDLFLMDCGYQGFNDLPKMVPFKTPSKNSNLVLSHDKTQFNYVQRKYRSSIERVFGEIKNAYTCFAGVFNGSPDRCAELFRFAAALINAKKRMSKGMTPVFL